MMKKEKKAILFDLDGTLIDSSEGITKSVAYTLEHYGIPVPPLESLYKFIGPPLIKSFHEFYHFPMDQAREAVDVYRERYNRIGLFECSLYPGVEDCLRTLKERGYRISIASSKPEQTCRSILEYHHVLDLFDQVVGATMDGRIDTKEEVLRELTGRWKDLSVDQMILVGDTIFDIEGANRLGMDSIGVSFGFGDRESMKEAGALTICNSMEEVSAFFAE